MKKYSSLVTIVLSGLIVVLGYFAYQKYIRPIYLNNDAQKTTVHLNGQAEVLLTKLPEQSSIYGIELEISEYPVSNYTMQIINSNQMMHEARVKKGSAFVFKNDWYGDSCTLVIVPSQNSGHVIEIEYRFLGLNQD